MRCAMFARMFCCHRANESPLYGVWQASSGGLRVSAGKCFVSPCALCLSSGMLSFSSAATWQQQHHWHQHRLMGIKRPLPRQRQVSTQVLRGRWLMLCCKQLMLCSLCLPSGHVATSKFTNSCQLGGIYLGEEGEEGEHVCGRQGLMTQARSSNHITLF